MMKSMRQIIKQTLFISLTLASFLSSGVTLEFCHYFNGAGFNNDWLHKIRISNNSINDLVNKVEKNEDFVNSFESVVYDYELLFDFDVNDFLDGNIRKGISHTQVEIHVVIRESENSNANTETGISFHQEIEDSKVDYEEEQRQIEHQKELKRLQKSAISRQKLKDSIENSTNEVCIELDDEFYINFNFTF